MRILVVEDEQKIARAVKKGLTQESFAVDVVFNGDDGYTYAAQEPYDVIVLDRMLPGMDGMEICRRLRAEGLTTPILMLTAKDQVSDTVDGLAIGADDYLVKPFAFDELVARIRSLLRRPPALISDTLQVGPLMLDVATYRVARGLTPIALTHKEFSVLEYLMRNPGRTVSKEMIMQHAWDYDADILPNTVEVFIGYLRTKIDKPFKGQPALIHTIRGFGYKLEA